MAAGAVIVTVHFRAALMAMAVRSMILGMPNLAAPVFMRTTSGTVIVARTIAPAASTGMIVPGVGMSLELLSGARWARLRALLAERLLGRSRVSRKQPDEGHR
jgi:hypothetical protein